MAVKHIEAMDTGVSPRNLPSVEVRKVEAKKKRKKKKSNTLVATTFRDLYTLTGETLGEGSYGKVETCKNVYTGLEYAVKIIEKRPGIYNRSKVLKEIEIYHLCRGHQNIIQLIEYFEEDEYFYLIFEKTSYKIPLDGTTNRSVEITTQGRLWQKKN